MKSLLHILSTLVLSLVFLLNGQAQAQAASCQDGQPVKLADLNWESAAFTTHVISKLLSLGYGCNTQIVPGASAAVESALVQNDVQIIAEVWSGRSEIIEQAIQQGKVKVVGDTLAGGAEQGWYVPDYLVHGDPDRGIQAQIGIDW